MLVVNNIQGKSIKASNKVGTTLVRAIVQQFDPAVANKEKANVVEIKGRKGTAAPPSDTAMDVRKENEQPDSGGISDNKKDNDIPHTADEPKLVQYNKAEVPTPIPPPTSTTTIAANVTLEPSRPPSEFNSETVTVFDLDEELTRDSNQHSDNAPQLPLEGEIEAREWVEEVVGYTLPDDFIDALSDGIILCRYISVFSSLFSPYSIHLLLCSFYHA